MKQNNLGGAQFAGAILALAVMVFLITFAMNYLGKDQPNSPIKARGKNEAPPRELTFRTTTAPELGFTPGKAATRDHQPYQMVLECEGKGGGSQDFWFVNDNKEPMDIGLDHKNCSCS